MGMYVTLIIVGFVAGTLSGSVGFGGGMILLPVITYFYGVEIAVPVATIAQMLSNLSRAGMGWRHIEWRQVARFLLTAAPLTALGGVSFALIDKRLMTCVLSVCLIIFAVLKMRGKMHLPKGRKTMLIGGGLTGLINGLLGISGPLSSAVFLTLDLAPVSYIASEAAAAAAMHMVKAVTYGQFSLMNGHIFLSGLWIGCAMMAGNVLAMHLIRFAHKAFYRKLVAAVMIAASLWLLIQNI